MKTTSLKDCPVCGHQHGLIYCPVCHGPKYNKPCPECNMRVGYESCGEYRVKCKFCKALLKNEEVKQ